jgi:hypothetical protein
LYPFGLASLMILPPFNRLGEEYSRRDPLPHPCPRPPESVEKVDLVRFEE